MSDVKKRILIVEDNPTNMKLIGDLLEVSGFMVLRADNGNSALEILNSTTPDLILLDINLPRMSGLQLFKKIKENPTCRSVRIVAVTALAMETEKKQILSLGFSQSP